MNNSVNETLLFTMSVDEHGYTLINELVEEATLLLEQRVAAHLVSVGNYDIESIYLYEEISSVNSLTFSVVFEGEDDYDPYCGGHWYSFSPEELNVIIVEI